MKTVQTECNDYTTEELLKMKKSEATENLTEKQQRFCEYYVEGHNKTLALKKAGYDRCTPAFSYRFFRSDDIRRYIAWLKSRVVNAHLVQAYDVIDAWMRIAFTDATDFVNIHPYNISLKPVEDIDGQLIKSIKSGRDGISLEFYDKMKALDNLAKYMDDMPDDVKTRLEKRKVELMEQEFELKKKTAEMGMPKQEDDGFIAAIKESVESIWDTSENS